jgi:hypothetical protein
MLGGKREGMRRWTSIEGITDLRKLESGDERICRSPEFPSRR